MERRNTNLSRVVISDEDGITCVCHSRKKLSRNLDRRELLMKFRNNRCGLQEKEITAQIRIEHRNDINSRREIEESRIVKLPDCLPGLFKKFHFFISCMS